MLMLNDVVLLDISSKVLMLRKALSVGNMAVLFNLGVMRSH